MNGDRLINEQRGTGPQARGVVQAAPSVGPTAAVQLPGLIQAILALDPTINRPPRQTVPPAQFLGRYLSDFVQRQLPQLGVTGLEASMVHGALQTVINEIQVPLHDLLQANQEAQRLCAWWAIQSAHQQAVEVALVNGLVKGLSTESRRFQAISAERGGIVVAHHLAIAMGSPLPSSPACAVFWTAAIFQWVAQGVTDYWELLQLMVHPEEGIVSLLQMAHIVLSLAFSPHGQALEQAEALGNELAHSFADELFNAIFPSLETVMVLGVPLREAVGPVPLLVASAIPGRWQAMLDRSISPFLIPWTLGTFVGPLLVDIALAILAPEGGWLRAATIAAGRRFRLIQAALDKMKDVTARVRRFALGASEGTHLPPSPLGSVERGLVDPPRTPSPSLPPHAPPGLGILRTVDLPRESVSEAIELVGRARRAVAHGASIPDEAKKLTDIFVARHLKIDRSDTRGLFEMFKRALQANQPTAGAGELVTVERYLNNPNVTKIKVIPQSHTRNVYSPDLEVRYSGGTIEKVEIKTRTTPHVDAGQIYADILDKVGHGQLRGQRGAIVLVVEHPPDEFGEAVARAIEKIRSSVRGDVNKWRNIRRIEIAPGVGTPLIFDRVLPPEYFRVRR